MNFRTIKQNSKDIISSSKPSPIAVALLYVAVTMLLSYLAGAVTSGNVTDSAMANIENYMVQGRYDYAITEYEKLMPSNTAVIIDCALQIVQQILSAGFIIFLLHCVRKTGEACIANLLDGFAVAWRLILLYLLEGLFVFLWSLLLVAPGIIASYSYRQAVYILLDNPEISPMECIRRSKAMMKGHKWQLFTFDLSFIGWYLLSMIPVAQIWTEPYIGISRILYYEDLIKNTDSQDVI